MRQGLSLLFIIILAVAAGYVVWPNNPGLNIPFLGISNPLTVHEGLDLQGGISVKLKPEGFTSSSQQLKENVGAAESQIAQRVSNGLGVNDADIRQITIGGLPGLLVELPGLNTSSKPSMRLLKAVNLLSGPPAATRCNLVLLLIHHSMSSITIIASTHLLQEQTWTPLRSLLAQTRQAGLISSSR